MNLWSDIMEKIYNMCLDNIYLFCFIMAICFVVIVVIVYLIKDSRYKEEEEIDIEPSNDINKEELEKITDEEIEKRIIEEYNQEKAETISAISEDEKIDTEDSKIEEIISALENAKKAEPSEVLKTFEEEQEEQAIISYKQLVESVRNNKISIVDDEAMYKNNQVTDDKLDILAEEIEAEPITQINNNVNTVSKWAYKPNEFISPVFGRMDSSNVSYRQGLEYTNKKVEPKQEVVAAISKVSEEPKHVVVVPKIDTNTEIFAHDVEKVPTYDFDIKHLEKMTAEDFLNNLKEFRSNL